MSTTETCKSCVYYSDKGGREDPHCQLHMKMLITGDEENLHADYTPCDDFVPTPLARIAVALEKMITPDVYSPIVGPRGTIVKQKAQEE